MIEKVEKKQVQEQIPDQQAKLQNWQTKTRSNTGWGQITQETTLRMDMLFQH